MVAWHIRILMFILGMTLAGRAVAQGRVQVERIEQQAANALEFSLRHPTFASRLGRSANAYRRQSGEFGERLALLKLRQDGWSVIRGARSNGTGIDMVAIRRGAGGVIVDMRFVEVKTTFGHRPRLGQTAYGRQLSRKWIAKKMKELRYSANPAERNLAKQIQKWRQEAPDRQLARRAVIIHVDTKRRVIRQISANGATSVQSVAMVVRRGLVSRSATLRQRFDRAIALTQCMRGYEPMPQYLARSRSPRGASTGMRAGAIALVGGGRDALRAVSRGTYAKLFIRGGALGAFVTALTVAEQVEAYRNGTTSRRDLIREGSGSVGGVFGGAAVGAAGGIWLGPPGAVIGTIVGGIAGVIGGQKIASVWSEQIDEKAAARAIEWIRRSPLQID